MPGLRPAAQSLSLASPRESNQREGDPGACVPSLREGQPALLAVWAHCTTRTTHCVRSPRTGAMSQMTKRTTSCAAQPTALLGAGTGVGAGMRRAIASLGLGCPHPNPLPQGEGAMRAFAALGRYRRGVRSHSCRLSQPQGRAQRWPACEPACTPVPVPRSGAAWVGARSRALRRLTHCTCPR